MMAVSGSIRSSRIWRLRPTPEKIARVRASPAIAAIVAALTVLGSSCSNEAVERPVVLATTTSVGNSGLLDALLPALQADTGLSIRTHLVGSGRALAMLADGQADAALTHAPEAEAAAIAQHPSWVYRKLMFNDFVIVGPKADPSAVATSRDAVEAFSRIARSHALFISRGDGSGTEEREMLLWKLAGIAPQPSRRVVAGAGMGATLRIADQMDAYTLVDRATFMQNAQALSVRVLCQGDSRLLNTYAIVYENDVRAARFAEWLAEGRGRQVTDAYRIEGQPAFSVWPAQRPHSRPNDLPR